MLDALYRSQKKITVTESENNMFTMWIRISETKEDPTVNYCIQRLREYASTNNKNLHIITSEEDIPIYIQLLIDVGIPSSLGSSLGRTYVDNLVWLKNNYTSFSPTEPNGMRIQHLSDILRYSLLATFGGMWIDASSILNDEVPNWNGKYDIVVPSRFNVENIMQAIFPDKHERFIYITRLLGLNKARRSLRGVLERRSRYDDNHIQLAGIPENWFIWCKPKCRPMILWAYYTLSQARTIMTSDMTQKAQVLRNLDLPNPREPSPIPSITKHYLWTYTVFAYVCRILNAHIDGVKNLFGGEADPKETSMTFSKLSRVKVGLLPFASHKNCFTIKPWLFKMTTSCREHFKSIEVTPENVAEKIEEIMKKSHYNFAKVHKGSFY